MAFCKDEVCVKPQHLVLPFLFCRLGSHPNSSMLPPAIVNLKIYDCWVQLLSHFQLLATLGTAAHQASLSFTVCLSLLKLLSIESVMPSNHHILCHPLLHLSFPALGSFPVSQLFASSGQTIGASSPVLPMNIQNWFPLGLTGLISLMSKGLSRVFSSTTVWKHQFFSTQPSLWSNSHISTWLLEKPYLWLYGPLLAKWCLCFVVHCLGLS